MHSEDPTIYLIPKHLFRQQMDMPSKPDPVPFGKARVRRSGRDVTVVSWGNCIEQALESAAKLDGDVSVEVIDLRSIVPYDEAAVMASVSKTKRAVVVHEAVTRCGFGAELSSRIHEELFGTLAAPVQRVGGKNIPIPYASNLEKAFLPQVADVVAAVKRTNK